jgi:NADH:ubiquinone oxidoreductase subunit 6 (subunit J)
MYSGRFKETFSTIDKVIAQAPCNAALATTTIEEYMLPINLASAVLKHRIDGWMTSAVRKISSQTR